MTKPKRRDKPWFDDECSSTKREMRRLSRRLHDNPYCIELRHKYLAICKQYKRLLKKKQAGHKDKLVKHLVEMADTNPKCFWETLDTLKRFGTENANSSESIPTSTWLEHFKKLGIKTDVSEDPILINELRQREVTGTKEYDAYLNHPITIKEIKSSIKILKNNKASSSDLVINEMLKYGAEVLLPGMAKLFNLVMDTSCFPTQWNTTFQVPLFKSGDPLNCNNYRGISIASCLGKLFNGIMSKRLNNFLDEYGKLSKNQAAFRNNHSTLDHMFTLKTLITKYVKQLKCKIFACFVDFRKAFDTVWRNGMLLKLKRLGVSGKFYELVKHMYSETTSSIKLPNGLSDMFQTNTGIKQGDNLSPTLFNIFIDDITDVFQHCGALNLGEARVSCLIYADDLLILSDTPGGLQKALNNLDKYCKTWHLEVNTEKTHIVIFRATKKIEDCEFSLGQHIIKIVDQVKYLGIIWTYTGNFDHAMKDLKIRAMRAMFKIISSLKSQQISCGQIYTKLFDSMVKPILLYGCQVWGQTIIKCMAKDDFGQLDKLPFEDVHNKLCKIALNVGKYSTNLAARAELGRYPLIITIAVLTLKFWSKLTSSPEKLSYQAYIEEREGNRCGFTNWITFFQTITSRCNLSMDKLINYPVPSFGEARNTMEKQYETHFFKRLNSDFGKDGKSGNKLRTYKHIKKSYTCETYIAMNLSPKLMSTIAQFRISSHDLEIERGRKVKPRPIPADQRFCRYCKDQVEDEIHFIFTCPLYHDLRIQLFDNCGQVHGTTSTDVLRLFTYFLSSENREIATFVGRFLSGALWRRAEYLY